MKILLADDHPVVMLGAANVLTVAGGHQIVGYASSASELVLKARSLSPDVIVTDYNMPGDAHYGDGLVLIRHLRRSFPQIKILIYTMITSPLIVTTLYDAGVRGVLFKSGEESELLDALSVISGDDVYRPSGHQALAERLLPKNLEARIDSLSTREIEVIRNFLSGLSVSDIALKMHRSVKTISTHKISAMRKLGVTTDHELVMLGLCNDLFA